MPKKSKKFFSAGEVWCLGNRANTAGFLLFVGTNSNGTVPILHMIGTYGSRPDIQDFINNKLDHLAPITNENALLVFTGRFIRRCIRSGRIGKLSRPNTGNIYTQHFQACVEKHLYEFNGILLYRLGQHLFDNMPSQEVRDTVLTKLRGS